MLIGFQIYILNPRSLRKFTSQNKSNNFMQDYLRKCTHMLTHKDPVLSRRLYVKLWLCMTYSFQVEKVSISLAIGGRLHRREIILMQTQDTRPPKPPSANNKGKVNNNNTNISKKRQKGTYKGNNKRSCEESEQY